MVDGRARIEGIVHGDVMVLQGDAVVTRGAEIDGDVRTSQPARISPQATVRGEVGDAGPARRLDGHSPTRLVRALVGGRAQRPRPVGPQPAAGRRRGHSRRGPSGSGLRAGGGRPGRDPPRDRACSPSACWDRSWRWSWPRAWSWPPPSARRSPVPPSDASCRSADRAWPLCRLGDHRRGSRTGPVRVAGPRARCWPASSSPSAWAPSFRPARQRRPSRRRRARAPMTPTRSTGTRS